MAVKKLEALFTANGTQVISEIERIAKTTETKAATMGEKFAAFGKTVAIGTGIAGAAIAGFSVKVAADFEQQTTTLVTGAGESEKALGMVRQGLLDMAVATGTSTKQLADGMFMVESAGYHGAAGLLVMKAAAEGAKVGNADLGVTANAVTTVMKDYHIPVTQAADATNFLVSVVSQGKTHMQDLAGAVSTILPIASSLHVPLADVGGALATLTSHGIAADQAATYLRFSLSAIVSPTGPAKKGLAEVGLSATDLGNALTQHGLVAALELLQTHLKDKFPQGGAAMLSTMSHILGGVRGMGAALGLTGQNLAEFIAATDKTGSSIAGAHGKVLGWALVQKDFNFQLDQAHQVINTLGIKIGMFLIPILKDVGVALVDTVNWFQKNKDVAEALGIAIGTVLTAAVAAFIETKIVATIKNISSAFSDVAALVTRVVAFFTGSAGAAAADAVAQDTDAAAATANGVAHAVAGGEMGIAGEAGIGLAGTLGTVAAAATVAGIAGYGLSKGIDAVYGSTTYQITQTDRLAKDSLPRLSKSVQQLFQDNQTNAVSVYDVNKALGLHLTTTTDVTTAIRQHYGVVETLNTLHKQFSDVLQKSPAEAGKFIAAIDGAGISTKSFNEQLAQWKVRHDDATAASERLQYKTEVMSGTVRNMGGVIYNAQNEVIGYASAFGFIPASKVTTLTAIDNASATINSIKAGLASLAVGVAFGIAGVPKHAKGGVARGWSLVGEKGPELVNFTNPGRVYTADDTQSMMSGGGGGGDTNIVVNVQADTIVHDRDFEDMVARAVISAGKTGGLSGARLVGVTAG